MFASGQTVHYWSSPGVPAVLCAVVWEGLENRAGVQVMLLQNVTTGHKFTAPATRVSAVPLELGICNGCHAQPCQCANRKKPNWIAELEAELTRIHGPAL